MLALARALMRDPAVVFLDGPCSNLDGRAIRKIETMQRTAHKGRKTIIIATHDPSAGHGRHIYAARKNSQSGSCIPTDQWQEKY